MESNAQKTDFLKHQYIKILSSSNPNAERLWGKMNWQQMIEHMADSFQIANGRNIHKLVSPPEIVEKMQAFLMSEKPFKENTPNNLLPETPPNPRHKNLEDAIYELQEEINHFFLVFEKEPSKTIMNPFFGELNFQQWVQLLHKHAWHHLKQFGIS